ncbi:hypothetical protein CW677_08735 [Macrococcoides caseolyticum]|uniref:hypothetical protein n=1 Tax=Macrococcoides caseolyticum TaxID=69966 RepID=UPI000C32DF7A|nr:hypothetical protein [Macrococcus caseolyticus]PKE47253.1 hypothetical protein CW677_08735 [Macrococcus caseolyticus]
MIKAGDKVILDGVEYVIKEIKGNDVLLVKRDDALNIMFMNEKTLYAKLYEQQKQRADELENTLAYIKSHLNNLWHNGDATEHEYAYNTLKYIESLQENNNA